MGLAVRDGWLWATNLNRVFTSRIDSDGRAARQKTIVQDAETGDVLYLRAAAKGDSVRSLRSLYTLLLMKLAVEGYPIKPGSRTAAEYAGEHPDLRNFAKLYTSLRYRERLTGGGRTEEIEKLRGEYRGIVKSAKRSGLPGLIRRVFSLKDLRY